jgi:hypothetical protein
MEIERRLPEAYGIALFRRCFMSAVLLLCFAITLSACQTAPIGTAPVLSQPSPIHGSTDTPVLPAGETFVPSGETPGLAAEITETPSPTTAPQFSATPLPFGACTNGLAYLGDVNYPDRTKVAPGQPLEKRWRVRNSGQCDWGPEYRFRWTGGTKLAAQDEFALFPAAAGSEAVIVIPMIAPAVPGEYTSDWRAVSPLGVPFGDALYIDIIVAE